MSAIVNSRGTYGSSAGFAGASLIPGEASAGAAEAPFDC